MQMHDIPIPENCKYVTLYETLMVNAQRHKRNAENYMSIGNVHHAIGSYRKMIKNFERAWMLVNVGAWK